MWLTRHYMYQQIKEFFDEAPRFGKVLAVSGHEFLFPMFDSTKSTLVEANYPAHDMMNLDFPDETFDFVVSDQVLEHVADPFKAVGEVYRVLRKGGYAIHTTCFMDRVHPHPNDYWRMSPDALKYLHKNFSEIVQCGSWGNRLVYIVVSIRRRFRLIDIPHRWFSFFRWLSTRNDPIFPVVTWIIARK